MPRITEKRRQAQRARIIAATQACFLRRGIHQTSMQDIIRESDLSAGAVYGYFASKEELIVASIAESMHSVAEVLDPIASAPPSGGLFAALKAIWEGLNLRRQETGIDYGRLALLGLAEAQTDTALNAHLQEQYRVFLARCADLARLYDDIAEPDRTGKLVFVLMFGLSAARSLLGPDAGIDREVIEYLQGKTL
ncbi:MAG: TetR/AcrR family transcriptional regulator [Rhodobacterales bacterium]|nr:TetR/AcrR family transcriptional regulator [Rhodobacterales bacterium]